MSDLIERASVLKAIDEYERLSAVSQTVRNMTSLREIVQQLPSAQPKRTEKRTETHACDSISRQAAIDALMKRDKELRNINWYDKPFAEGECRGIDEALAIVSNLPSAQPEQRYTEEELRVFAHGISLSLLSKRSAQHWRYDEDTATEIKFLERLYDKVVADMGDEQDG